MSRLLDLPLSKIDNITGLGQNNHLQIFHWLPKCFNDPTVGLSHLLLLSSLCISMHGTVPSGHTGQSEYRASFIVHPTLDSRMRPLAASELGHSVWLFGIKCWNRIFVKGDPLVPSLCLFEAPCSKYCPLIIYSKGRWILNTFWF